MQGSEPTQPANAPEAKRPVFMPGQRFKMKGVLFEIQKVLRGNRLQVKTVNGAKLGETPTGAQAVAVRIDQLEHAIEQVTAANKELAEKAAKATEDAVAFEALADARRDMVDEIAKNIQTIRGAGAWRRLVFLLTSRI